MNWLLLIWLIASVTTITAIAGWLVHDREWQATLHEDVQDDDYPF